MFKFRLNFIWRVCRRALRSHVHFKSLKSLRRKNIKRYIKPSRTYDLLFGVIEFKRSKKVIMNG